jgi:hypothetical protein
MQYILSFDSGTVRPQTAAPAPPEIDVDEEEDWEEEEEEEGMRVCPDIHYP